MIECAAWKPSRGLELEPNAYAAATSQGGSIALMAGPGAGKTEMLAQRADFLLRTGTTPYPKRILAIAFKKDASTNLKERVEERCGKELASRFDSYTFHAFSKRIIDIFRPFLSGQDALDEDYTVGQDRGHRTQITFADMVPLANDIIGNCPVARNSIRQTYSDVFLDEFQDCTNQQYALIRNAFLGQSARLIAVGDTKQKIMGWAGALEGVFLKFGSDFGATALNLYQNFRSLPRIRRVHNSMIKDFDPQAAVPDDSLAGEEGVVAVEAFPTEREEAIWIAGSIESWVAGGVPLHDIAILCNTQPHLYACCLMEELARRNIPFRNEQVVQDLFCEPIYKVIVDYLVVLLGTTEPDSWERLLSAIASDSFDDTSDVRAREWNQFIKDQQARLSACAELAVVWRTVEDLLEKMGSAEVSALSQEYEHRDRLRDLVEQTKTQIEGCCDGSGVSVERLKGLSEISSVRILTIHKCKGLEFDAVIVQGVEEETFFGNDQEAKACAYFVAISRAKHRLVITHALQRAKPSGANSFWRVSRTPHQQFIDYVTPHIGGTNRKEYPF